MNLNNFLYSCTHACSFTMAFSNLRFTALYKHVFLFSSVPWLIPILQVEEVAQGIVEAVQENQSMVIFPKILGKIIALKRFVYCYY